MSTKIRTWTNYNAAEDTKKYGHNFEKEKIMLKKAGETFNVYDRIQAANVDVDIYETLAKYNMLPTRENAAQMLNVRGEAMFGDMRLLEGEHPQDFIDRANNLWESLPLDVRAQFGHDRKRFSREGADWLKNNLKNYIKSQEEGQNNKSNIQNNNTDDKGDNK